MILLYNLFSKKGDEKCAFSVQYCYQEYCPPKWKTRNLLLLCNTRPYNTVPKWETGNLLTLYNAMLLPLILFQKWEIRSMFLVYNSIVNTLPYDAVSSKWETRGLVLLYNTVPYNTVSQKYVKFDLQLDPKDQQFIKN